MTEKLEAQYVSFYSPRATSPRLELCQGRSGGQEPGMRYLCARDPPQQQPVCRIPVSTEGEGASICPAHQWSACQSSLSLRATLPLQWKSTTEPQGILASYCCCCLVTKSCPTLLNGLYSARLLYPWDFAGKSTGAGCHFLLQGIFPTQELNLGFPHIVGRRFYHLSHLGSHYN